MHLPPLSSHLIQHQLVHILKADPEILGGSGTENGTLGSTRKMAIVHRKHASTGYQGAAYPPGSHWFGPEFLGWTGDVSKIRLLIGLTWGILGKHGFTVKYHPLIRRIHAMCPFYVAISSNFWEEMTPILEHGSTQQWAHQKSVS